MKKQAHSKRLCIHCLKSFKGNGTCGTNGHKDIRVSHKIHFPSPAKSKFRWKKFIEITRLDKWGYFNEPEIWKIFEKSISKLR